MPLVCIGKSPCCTRYFIDVLCRLWSYGIDCEFVMDPADRLVDIGIVVQHHSFQDILIRCDTAH
jgi:hypothetical protein